MGLNPKQPPKPAGRVDAQGRPRRADGGFADPRDQQAHWDRVHPEWGAGGATPWSTSKKWKNAPGMWQKLQGSLPQQPAAPQQPAGSVSLELPNGMWPSNPAARKALVEDYRKRLAEAGGGPGHQTPAGAAGSAQPQDGGWGDVMPAPGQAPWNQHPSRDFDYQPAFNAQGQAINSGSILGRLAAEGRYTPGAGSPDGNRAASDLSKSMMMESAVQGARGLEQENAAQNAKEQQARSEAMQSALGNQTKMYNAANQRATDQMSLAAQLQQAMIASRNRFREALMQ